MFCYQCEEAKDGQGCTTAGICGKTSELAGLQDKLICLVKGIAFYRKEQGSRDDEADNFVMESLFMTLTNTNFDKEDFKRAISKAVEIRDRLGNVSDMGSLPEAATITVDDMMEKDVGVLSTKDVNVRSLRELLTYGLKGLAAYTHHAQVLGYEDSEILKFINVALSATLEEKSIDELVSLVLECGKYGVDAMALLDKANTEKYGNPEPRAVSIGTRDRPAILISGHDLKDMEQLLEQTQGTGVDVYTHGEMLPANCYPQFSKFENLVGNYGGAWWSQREEFEKFNGSIIMTTNCIVKPKESYRNRIFTTGVAGYDGVEHIPSLNGNKDFGKIIGLAKGCNPPIPLEEGEVMAGFAHEAVLSVADKVVEAIKAGKIRRFFVMAGCDGRHKERSYYTEFAKSLPKDTIILTAGCAKYRYNKLQLGDIDGIPRVLDAGQCNDSYSLVVIAQKLAEAFDMEDINELPISYNIAWYEQKAVLVLLALLHLGVKDITLGPRLPAFVSPDVLNVLVENFGIRKNGTVEEDMELMLK